MITSRQIGAASDATSVTRTGPVDEGDHLTAFVSRSWDSDADPVTMPGWELIGDSLGTGNEWAPVLRIFTRRATGTEPGSWSISAGSGVTVVLVASTGVDRTDPLAAEPVFTSGGGASGTAPALTPDGAPSQALWAVTHQSYNAERNTVLEWTGTDGEAGEITAAFLNLSTAYQARTDTAETGTPGWTITPWNGNTDAVSAGLVLREQTATEPEPEPEPEPDPEPGLSPSYPGLGGFYPGAAGVYPGSLVLSGDGPSVPEVPGPPAKVAPRPPALVVDAPSSSWLFGIGPAKGGGITYELPQTTGRKFSAKLTEPADASFEMDGRDPVAVWIDELATDLHVLYRRSPADPRQQLYRGRIGKASDKIDRVSHRLMVPSVDYRGVLKRRYLFTGSQQVWDGYDQIWIAYGLIDQTQNAAGGGGDLGIVNGAVPSGVVRTRNYELQDEIGAKIQELSEVTDGFDWDIVAVNPTRLEFQAWYPRRGLDRDVLIELGGAASELSRDVDSSAFANAIRMTGRAPEGGGDEPPPHERYAEDIATNPAGRWEAVIGTDLTTAAAVNDRIGWQLAESQVVRPSYTFTMKRGWWQGPDHCWVGDGVLVKVYSGRLRVDTIMRIHQMDFTPDPNGGEAVQITVNAPKPDPARRAASIEQRLSALERR